MLDGANNQTKKDTTKMTRATLQKKMREVMGWLSPSGLPR